MLYISLMKVFPKFIIFCIVGGLSLVIDLAFVNLFFYMGFPFVAARVLSIFIALIFNFFANRGLTFGATHKRAVKQVLPYIVVYIIANLVNLGASVLVVQLAGENVVNINVASLIGTGVSIPISFFGSLLWTFKKK